MAEYLYCGADLDREEFPFTCYRSVGHDGTCEPVRDSEADEQGVDCD